MNVLKENRGFMLVDVIIAIFLVCVALVPISGLFTQSIQTSAEAADYTRAANLIQQQLELLKTKPPEYWAELALPCQIPWQGNRLLPPSKYTLTSQATLSTLDSHLVQVNIIASWKERNRECNLQFVAFYPTLN